MTVWVWRKRRGRKKGAKKSLTEGREKLDNISDSDETRVNRRSGDAILGSGRWNDDENFRFDVDTLHF